MKPRLAARITAAATATVLISCTGRSTVGDAVVPKVSPAGSPMTYVAVGASETVGVGANDPIRDAWPGVFYRTALPRAAVYVNVGIPGATVAEALREEVPAAVEQSPDLVTVWLNVNDLVAGVSAAEYERRLTELLGRLRDGGATVLVANTPPLDRLPAYTRCLPLAPAAGGACDTSRRMPPSEVREAVDAYNEAVESAASATGAVVVDLHALGLRARSAGNEARLVAEDGFHPSTAGHAAVARAFAEAYRALRR